MKLRKNFKRSLSMLLCFALCLSTVSTAFAATNESEDALIAELAGDSSLYPDGAFSFYESQLVANEDDGKIVFDIVRKGGTVGEASVDFKAVDITTTYGKDYTLSVKENMFFTRVLGANPDAVPLAEFYTEEVAEKETVEEAATVEDKTVTVKAYEELINEATYTENELKADNTSPNYAGLRGIRNASTGTESDRPSWREVTETTDYALGNPKLANTADEASEYINQIAQEIPGIENTLNFKDGEYKKTITISLIDDNISETDEQVMFMLSNAENAELVGAYTAYLNIADNDENEPVIFSMLKNNVVALRSDGFADITVERISGVEKFASVIVGTGAVDARPDVDYKTTKTEIIFPQGIKSKTIRVPLLDNPSSNNKPVTFVVAIDTEEAYVGENVSTTYVTIVDEVNNDAIIKYVSDLTGESTEKIAEDEGVSLLADTYSRNLGSRSVKNGSATVATDVDISTAENITIVWSSSGKRTTSEGSGCDEHDVQHYGKELYIVINGIEKKFTSTTTQDSFNGTYVYQLPDNLKITSATIGIKAAHTGNNQTCNFNASSVIVNYPSINFCITNTSGEGYTNNTYREKIYSINGDKLDTNSRRYKDGNLIVMGQAQVKRNDGNWSENATVYRPSDGPVFTTTTQGYNTSQNIAVSQGREGNVYLAGYQLQEPNTVPSKWSDIIRPEDMVFNKAFLDKYKKKYFFTVSNTFYIRPVFNPNAASIKFNNSDPSKASYSGFSNDETFACTMIDTVELTGIAEKGYSVSGFTFDASRDEVLYSYQSRVIEKKSNNSCWGWQTVTYETINEQIANVSTRKVDINSKTSSTISNVITFAPVADRINVNMTYSRPQITVKIDPKNYSEYQDKGTVAFSDTDNPENSKVGNCQNVMLVSPVTLGQTYSLAAVTDDLDPNNRFKAYWKDWTGDDNGNGIIDTEESAAVAKYGIVRTASNGNIFTFIPQIPNTLIYYGFLPLAKNTDGNVIEGVVCLKDSPIFDKSKITITPINRAAVYADEYTAQTGYNSGHGGLSGRGGDGYFCIESEYFGSAENHSVSIEYNNLSLTASQPVNYAPKYVLDSYDTIDVTNAQMFKKNASNGYDKITKDDLLNDDAFYQIILTTNSDNDAIIATEAKFSFYRQDDSLISVETINSDWYDSGTSVGNGIFTYNFNPSTKKIPPGAYMTVAFSDQNATAYFEHKLGFPFGESLGVISIMSSFLTNTETLKIIGAINPNFIFGWDGNMDDPTSTYVKTENGIKTLNYGFNFNYGTDESQRDFYKSKASDNASAVDKEKAAKDAVDTKDNKKPSKLSASCYINFSFALGLTLGKSEAEGHVGEWYFIDMMLTVVAGGGVTVTMQFTTPIGIPIIISLGTGVSGQAIIVVQQTYDKKEYYIKDLYTTINNQKTNTINPFNFSSMEDSNRKFDRYGNFRISPYIDLSAGAGFDFLNLTVGGRATFNFNFTTLRKDSFGNVDLDAYIKLKLLFFTKKWSFANTSVEMFSEDSLVNGTYLYESIDDFNPSTRDYLANRTDWNSAVSLFSVASTSGMTETELMDGVYPNPDAKITDLGDGKLLAVFIDDVPTRTKNNSTAVYYTIFNGSTWSEPIIIENDGTADDSPTIYDIPGKNQAYVAWSTASEEFGDDVTALELLTSRDIHGCFFDKQTMAFDEIQEITKSVTGGGIHDDYYGDVKPQLAYYNNGNGKESMIVYYTKSEYTATDNVNGVYGDAVNPYSVIAYRFYDFIEEEWISTFTDTEKTAIIANYIKLAKPENEYANWLTDEAAMWAKYESGMYGQCFLDLAPRVSVNENLDENGYWTEQAEVGVCEGNVDPLITDSTVISYNDLALYAYVLDYDGKRETNNDRDIFMQIYNFKENTFTHPIMITSNSVPDEEIKFARVRGITMLTWLSDGSIKMFDISGNVSNGNTYKEGILNSQKYYYFEKTEAAGFIPPIVVAETKADDNMPDAEKKAITSFDIASSNDYVYALWTQRDIKLAEGVEEGSEEAADPKNRKVETQIYLSRYSVNESFMTKPIQVTDELGANYDDIGFSVNNDGSFEAIAVKGGSTTAKETVKDANGNNVEIEKYPVEDDENRKLVSLNFKPNSVITLNDAKVFEIGANSLSPAYVNLYNEGVETLKDLSITIKLKDGTELYNATGVSVYGGDTINCGFGIKFDEDDTGCEFEIVAKNSNGEEIFRKTYIQEEEVKMNVNSLMIDFMNRGTVRFIADIKNNGRISSGTQTFVLTYKKGEETKTLYSKEIEALSPGETTMVADIIDIDYDEVFTPEKGEDGYIQAETEIVATTNTGELATSILTLNASAKQMEAINAIDKIVADDVEIKGVNEFNKLEAKIFAKKTYNSDDISNKLKVKWVIEDEDIAILYGNGYVEGLKEGETTATAYIMPANNTVTESGEIDNYATLPNDAIKVCTTTIKVDKEVDLHRHSSSGGKTGIKILSSDIYGIPFKDITQNDWFYEAVKYAYQANLFSGVSDETFEPNTTMSRAMFVTVLYRLAGLPKIEVADSKFTDVENDMWYSDAVKWANANNIVMGVNDTEFMLNDDITREQMCVILGRYIENMGMELSASNEIVEFNDAEDISSYAKDMVKLMQATGIISGKGDNKFDPKGNATRAEVATIIQRFSKRAEKTLTDVTIGELN